MIADPPRLKRVTLAEFEAFICLPENRDRNFEYIAEEIVEMAASGYSSIITGIILTILEPMGMLEPVAKRQN